MKQRGQALVELALFLPIFLLLVIGLAEIAFLMYDYLVLEGDTRELARWVSRGNDYHRPDGEYGHVFIIADDLRLMPEFYAIQVQYVEIGSVDGLAVVQDIEVEGYGRIDEAEFPWLDPQQYVDGHQAILDVATESLPDVVWAQVDVAHWRDPVMGLYGMAPMRICSWAVFRVSYHREFRETER